MATIDTRNESAKCLLSRRHRAGHAPLLSALVRFLEKNSVALTPEQIGFMEGLRAATAVAVVVAIAWVLDAPTLGWAAFGAFWTCLADPGGPDRERFLAMGGLAIAGAITAPLAATLAEFGPLIAALFLLATVFLYSLSRGWGPAAAPAGLMASVVAVVAISFPRPPLAAAELGITFFSGSIWATTLCLLIWRIHPHGPARRAVAAAYARLQDMLADLLPGESGTSSSKKSVTLAADHRRAVRNAIEHGHALLARLPCEGDVERDYIRAGLDVADQLFATLIAIEHRGRNGFAPSDGAAYRETIGILAEALAELNHQSGRRMPDGSALVAIAKCLKSEPLAKGTLFAKLSAQSAAALDSLIRQWPPVALAPRRNPIASCKPAQSGSGLFAPPIVRHAVRAAIAVMVAYAAAQFLRLDYSYWATMATVVCMQPGASATWRRSLERILGSVTGAVIAAAGAELLSTQGALLLVIFPVAAATIALRSVSYTLFVAFLTPLFIFVSELLQPGHSLAWTRAFDNVVGALIGVGISSLWPERVRDAMEAALSKAIDANLAYAELVAGQAGSADSAIRDARRAAGIASTAAETCRQRLVLEGRRYSSHLDEAADVLAALRNLAGAATSEWLEADRPGGSNKTLLEAIDRLRHWRSATPKFFVPEQSIPTNGFTTDDLAESLHSLGAQLSVYLRALV
ncbi:MULTISPECIES: FUSC family protein [unclassified Rhizobium]|uniref:FUSC family protein n=1 Tax=unclassified Rhizobium TaxID=2613769 RepID=UPI0010453CBA|nr:MULTISPECIES: FUSC family protein [unclassified Rhizobium]MBB3397014.1 putative membrane protein YccC [Rhizobium sp. BK060]TCM75970.1 putative membrane protein YccC [Rhizobium sp. BK068]